MKKIFGILLFLFIIGVGSCEKDDICVEGDTPLMTIGFYNLSDTTTLKNVTSLRVVGEGKSSTVNTVTDRANAQTISIPLKTDANQTSFLLISNSADDDNGTETGNIDTITISYSRVEDFKSRACGFIVNYENLNIQLKGDSNNWIQDLRVAQSNIINSDSTHVKIFH
ncbi:DUF6452 family protein [Maribacter sp. CXY002]|uniref:DUF6452 family protein n=1 Tax=Maribacter luteocoastalis TaxID=3407671 RepID=UPI003B684B04